MHSFQTLFFMALILSMDGALAYAVYKLIIRYCAGKKNCHCENNMAIRSLISIASLLILLSLWLVYIILAKA